MGAAKPPRAFSATNFSSSRFAPLLLLAASLLVFFFLFSFPSRSSPLAAAGRSETVALAGERCNYSEGAWILEPDPDPSYMRYGHTYKEIFKGWNCIAGGKASARNLLRCRWRPSGCRLPRLDPLRLLERYRNTNIGFVGDSLNRNIFVSQVCMLRTVSGEVKKWRPAGADRGFTFSRYNVTVA